MNSNCNDTQCDLGRSPEALAKRVVLAGPVRAGAKVAEQFRTLGLGGLTRRHRPRRPRGRRAETDPHAILLPEDAGDESGYLACAKLRQSQPRLKVVVIGDAADAADASGSRSSSVPRS